MLTASQIQEMVKGGEGYNADFKRSVPSKVKEISDEVAGFANAAGGYVLIGSIMIIRLSVLRLITISVLQFKIRLERFLPH